jgi:zinc-binding alcohol dehydrogenase/oxidoreductase
MKAIIIADQEEPIQLLDKEVPAPGKGEVLVKLMAAALNRRDQWIREGMYPGIVKGTTIGSDGAGVVVEVGEGITNELVGMEAVINPNIGWGDNPAVQATDYSILGMPSDGTFAECVVVAADRLHEKPKHLSWQEAAALPLGGLTAYRALFHHGALEPGKKVLISGVGGGVAQFAFQFAEAIGAEVYVTSGQDLKIEESIKRGAKTGFNYKLEGWQSKALETSGGFDLVIDSAGGDQLNSFIKIMRPAGRIVFYGATHGMPSKLDVFRMFWNQISLQGSTMGNDEEFAEMLQLVSKQKIKPVIDSVYPLEDAIAALDRIKSGVFGKVVLNTSA